MVAHNGQVEMKRLTMSFHFLLDFTLLLFDLDFRIKIDFKRCKVKTSVREAKVSTASSLQLCG